MIVVDNEKKPDDSGSSIETTADEIQVVASQKEIREPTTKENTTKKYEEIPGMFKNIEAIMLF